MTLQELNAMKLALEALDGLYMPNELERVNKAITAINEVLAEHAMSKVQRLGQEIEQEPVAREAVYETIIHWDECGGKRSRRELASRIVSLYTAPPQRKPLSAEQVSEICAEWTDENGNTGSFGRRQIARAIEAAHGIKE